MSRCPRLGWQFSRRYAISTTLQSPNEPLRVGEKLKGHSGRVYMIEKSSLIAESPCYASIEHDIKANNILVDYDEGTQGEIIIKKVQISVLEDAVLVPPGKWLRGPLCGNAMWRSPESWCRSRQNQASYVYSFAIVMIYVMLNEMVFRVPDSELQASDSWRYILRRHISYFADEQGFAGLLEHIGESNDFHERLIKLAGDFTSESPRQPFESWEYVEPELGTS